MTFDPARPRYTLPLAGTDYELLGTLEVVEAVEHAFKDGITQVTWRAPEMGVTDTAKLLAAMLGACGHKTTARQVAETLFNTVGVNTDAFQMVKMHAFAFLRIVLEPPELREKKAKEMGELIGGLGEKPASRGKSTRKPA